MKRTKDKMANCPKCKGRMVDRHTANKEGDIEWLESECVKCGYLVN